MLCNRLPLFESGKRHEVNADGITQSGVTQTYQDKKCLAEWWEFSTTNLTNLDYPVIYVIWYYRHAQKID